MPASGDVRRVGWRNEGGTWTYEPGFEPINPMTAIPPGPAPHEVEPDGAVIRVLLIEDDPGDAFLVEELLAVSGAGFAFTWARTLAAGIEAMTTGADCVLVDLGLPDAQGLEAVEAIIEHTPGMAVVVLTGFEDRSVGAQAVALGAQDFLVKGTVDHQSLTRALRYAIARRHSEESSRQLREEVLLSAENSRLERGLIARPILHNPALQWAIRYQSGASRALLGGDFFDAIELDDGTVRVVVGDVSGHGPDEAALGVALRVAWRSLVLAGQPPGVAIDAMQRVLEAERVSPEIFATLCDIELEPNLGRAQIRLAGHPSPLLLSGSRVIELPAQDRGPLLGVFDGGTWAPNPFEFDQEWTMVVFTDGIVEGRSGQANDRFETSGLARLLSESAAEEKRLEGLADLLIAGAERANGEALSDDVALLLLSTSTRWIR
jgi:serine phosphatase RsbU (regulator of sigma subunit)